MLSTIYKAFAGPHLDYGDALFDHTCNIHFKKLEFVQCSACLALSRVIRSISKEKEYQKLPLDYLQGLRLCRKMCFLCKGWKIEHHLSSQHDFFHINIRKLLQHSDKSLQVHNILLQLCCLAKLVWNLNQNFIDLPQTRWTEKMH